MSENNEIPIRIQLSSDARQVVFDEGTEIVCTGIGTNVYRELPANFVRRKVQEAMSQSVSKSSRTSDDDFQEISGSVFACKVEPGALQRLQEMELTDVPGKKLFTVTVLATKL